MEKFEKGINEMKVLSKSAIVIILLTICLPVRGEILIYQQTIKCMNASEDSNLWDVEYDVDTSYLVLDVTYDVNGVINDVYDAEQINYYEITSTSKWYWQEERGFDVAEIELERGLLWVFMAKDTDASEGEISVLTGKAKNTNVGLGRDEPRVVAKSVKGDMLADWTNGEGILQICTISWRLQSRLTKTANDPNEGDQDFEYAITDVVKAYLNGKGYQEVW